MLKSLLMKILLLLNVKIKRYIKFSFDFFFIFVIWDFKFLIGCFMNLDKGLVKEILENNWIYCWKCLVLNFKDFFV